MHKVLKPFDYSPDGISVRQLKEGDVLAIQDDLVEGLAAAGLIVPTPKSETKSGGKAANGDGA